MIYQSISQHPNMVSQELPMYQSALIPQLQMFKTPLTQADQYKRPVMGSIVMVCSLMLLAMDGMSIFNDLWQIINNPTQVTYWTYIGLGLFIWAIVNSILSLICAIGQYMTFWGDLIIYIWITFAIFLGFEVYGTIGMVRGILAVTDPGVREEYIFFFIFDIAIYIIYAIRQICFLRLYNKPTMYYVLPYYYPQTQKP